MRHLALVAALLAGSVSPAAAETIAITNGTLVIGDGSEPIVGGTVVIRDGRVVSAGSNVSVPAGARVVDATNKWVTPGIVAGFSRLGLAEVDLGASGSDDTDTGGSPFNAAIDVFQPLDPGVERLTRGLKAAFDPAGILSPGRMYASL